MNGPSEIGMRPGHIESLLVHGNLCLVRKELKIRILTGCNVYKKTVLSELRGGLS